MSKVAFYIKKYYIINKQDCYKYEIMEHRYCRTYNKIIYHIHLIDLGEYVFWKVDNGKYITPELQEQMKNDLGYKDFDIIDFGLDHNYGIWEIKKNSNCKGGN